MSFQRIRVPTGLAFTLLYLFLCRPAQPFFFAGVGLAAVGLAVRVWASGHLEKWKTLAVHGPYRWTRNPLYFGSFLMGLGFSVASARWILVILFAVLFIIIYVPVMRKEEEELRSAYGPNFEDYRRRVPFLVPKPPFLWGQGSSSKDSTSGQGSSTTSTRGQGSSGNRNFEWTRVIVNREYQAAVGFAAVTAFLWLKMLWQ